MTGTIDLEPDSFIREESAKSKPKKHMFAVGTSKRVFMMFADTDQEQRAWIAALKRSLDGLRSGETPATSSAAKAPRKNSDSSDDGVADDHSGGGGGGASSSQTAGSFQTAGSYASGGGGRQNLQRVRSAISFLRHESKVLEFWQIWMESVPPAQELEPGKAITFTVTTSADLKKVTWRTSGPQNIFIQKMVDFFWNVGAPESEIDRLNDVGALINPVQIGSWIDMSSKDGMDGGWYFPVPMPLALCIEAADAGDPTVKLAEWAQRHGVEQCLSVGRDMGAAPPRQTEFRLALPGATASAQLDVALAAYASFGFPAIPDALLNVFKAGQVPGLLLSVVTSSDGFVRMGVLAPTPTNADIAALCAGCNASETQLRQFMAEAFGDKHPAFQEISFLQPPFGYNVYAESWCVGFPLSFSLCCRSDRCCFVFFVLQECQFRVQSLMEVKRADSGTSNQISRFSSGASTASRSCCSLDQLRPLSNTSCLSTLRSTMQLSTC